jgi:hypothetical protein
MLEKGVFLGPTLLQIFYFSNEEIMIRARDGLDGFAFILYV